MAEMTDTVDAATPPADWQRRVIDRSLRSAAARSVDRGQALVNAAATVLARSNGADITVQEVADEAGQSLRTLYQYFESKDDLLLAVFEEAMRTYASLIERAIGDLDTPLDRLAGAIIAAGRMPEFSGAGIDRGLARLRLALSETDPDRVATAQTAVAELVRGLVAAAADAGVIVVASAETTTFMVLAINGAHITADTLGNDVGVRLPSVSSVALFCLRGMGAAVDDAWITRVEQRLRLPTVRRGRAR